MYAHHRVVSEGTGGAIMTVTSTNSATSAVARLEVLAQSGASASGNAEMKVYSEHQDMNAVFKTSGAAGHAHFLLHTEGTDAAVMTVTSTTDSATSHAVLEVLAEPAGGSSASGNSNLRVYSKHQNANFNVESGGGDAITEFKTTFTTGKADMNIQSDGTAGSALTVLSTNTATTSIARFDLHAKPASGTTSGSATLSVTSKHGDSTLALLAGASQDATISFRGTNADKFVVGSDGVSHMYEVSRAAGTTAVADYEGSASVTVTGRLCQAWSSQTPHSHSYSSVGSHNYCRDPSGSGSLWCYTTDPSQATENCADPRPTW